MDELRYSEPIDPFAAPLLGLAKPKVQWGQLGVDVNNHAAVCLTNTDRPLGVVILGQTGFGKTSLMEHLIAEDIKTQTVTVQFESPTTIIFDPHGELSERVLRIGANMEMPKKFLFCARMANSS